MSAGLYTAEDWARFFEIHAEHGGKVTVDAAQALKIAAFLRASDLAEEPEWEYGTRYYEAITGGHPVMRDGHEFPWNGPKHDVTRVRRTKAVPAGPWLPVEQGADQTTNHEIGRQER